MLPRADRGKYPLGESMHKYIVYLQNALERRELLGEDGKGSDLRKQRARLLKAQADDAEIELAKKRGELIPIALYKQEIANHISTARANC